jgi:hypothetical protein
MFDEVIAGFEQYARDRQLAPAFQVPYLVKWVRRFLMFARVHGHTDFEACRTHVAEDPERLGAQRWQPGKAGRPDAQLCKAICTI